MKKTDKTLEVEKRISAIEITTCDTCNFFEVREDAIVGVKQCYYCKYAKFDNYVGVNQKGFCMFKRK